MRRLVASVVLLGVLFGGASRAIPQDRRDDPDLAHAHHVLGLALLGAGQAEAARAEGARAEEADPKACCGPSLLARAWWQREGWTPRVEGALERAQHAEHHPSESCCPWLDTRAMARFGWRTFAESWLRGDSTETLAREARELEIQEGLREGRRTIDRAVAYERAGAFDRALEWARSAEAVAVGAEQRDDVAAVLARVETTCRAIAERLLADVAAVSSDDDGHERIPLLRRALDHWPDAEASKLLRELLEAARARVPVVVKEFHLDDRGWLRVSFGDADEKMVCARGRLVITWGRHWSWERTLAPADYTVREVVVGGVSYGKDCAFLIAPPFPWRDAESIGLEFEPEFDEGVPIRATLRLR